MNGHKDATHWNVALWFNNDEGLYEMACERMRRHPDNERVADELRNMLGSLGLTHTPDGYPYTREAIKAALDGMEN